MIKTKEMGVRTKKDILKEESIEYMDEKEYKLALLEVLIDIRDVLLVNK